MTSPSIRGDCRTPFRPRWMFDGFSRPLRRAALTGLVLLSASIGMSALPTDPRPMSTPRWGAASAALPDGSVFVAGGWNGERELATAEIWNPTNGSWRDTGEMNEAREFPMVERLPDGRVLIAGGIDRQRGVVLSSVEIFDPAKERWTVVSSMAFARQDAASLLLADGRVVVLGGYDGVVPHPHVEVFDPESEKWTSLPDMPTARSGHVAARLRDGRWLVSGGLSDTGRTLASTELYDPATRKWSRVPSMSVDRSFSTVFLLGDGRVQVSGGRSDESGDLKSSEVFDPAIDAWYGAAPLSEARSHGRAVETPLGDILIVGGATARGESAAVDRFERFSGLPSAEPSLSIPRSSPIVVVSGHRLVVAGGLSLWKPVASAELREFPSLPTIESDPADARPCLGGSAGFKVLVGGTPPFTYQWWKSGGSIAGATTNVLTISNITASDVAAYACTVTNVHGQVISSWARLELAPNPVASAGSPQGTVAGSSVELSGSATECTGCSWAWSLAIDPGNGTTQLGPLDSRTPKFTANVPGLYVLRLVARNGWGCSSSPAETTVFVGAPGTAPVLNSFMLERGATSTNSASVTLDHVVMGGLPTYYLVSENAGFKGAEWIPYSPQPRFNLSTGQGMKVVYLKLRNRQGESTALLGSIVFNPVVSVRKFGINVGAAETTSTQVTLDHGVDGEPTEYLASESWDFEGAEWLPYAPPLKFSLQASRGLKSIFLKVRTGAIESAIVVDSILLLRD